jgi:hypothetical protein
LIKKKKTCGKITKFIKRIFFWKFLDWVGLGLAILVWASVSQPSEQWRTLHCSRKTVEDEAGEEKKEEEKRTCDEVLPFTLAVLWR